MNVPAFPLDSQARDVIDFCLYFLTVDGFMQIYDDNLVTYGKPGTAYEATEATHLQLFRRRRYVDRESFYNARAQHKRK